MTSSHLFVTGADIGPLVDDILDSELGSYDFLKLLYQRKYPAIDQLFQHFAHGFKLFCEGRMTPEMTAWVKHRRAYPDIETAMANWSYR